MKEVLINLIISNIKKWTDEDIYVISLFVYDENDNPKVVCTSTQC